MAALFRLQVDQRVVWKCARKGRHIRTCVHNCRICSLLLKTWHTALACVRVTNCLHGCFTQAISGSLLQVIFIDEIDSLCRKRLSAEQEHTRRVKTEFLKQMEGKLAILLWRQNNLLSCFWSCHASRSKERLSLCDVVVFIGRYVILVIWQDWAIFVQIAIFLLEWLKMDQGCILRSWSWWGGPFSQMVYWLLWKWKSSFFKGLVKNGYDVFGWWLQ